MGLGLITSGKIDGGRIRFDGNDSGPKDVIGESTKETKVETEGHQIRVMLSSLLV